MPVTLNVIESTTELGIELVTVTVASSSTPGPAGPGVPTGGTVNQVLTKDSSTDYDTSWQDAQGGAGGAPTDVDYLVGTASGSLSAEIVVGTAPGGELGGTWASPTVDATHSGSSHASVQSAAEATAAAALAAHEADTTGIHGIADTSALETAAGAQAKVDTHVNDTTDAHDASAISSVAAGNLVATDVQAALNELDTEKAATASAVMDGDAAGGVLSGTYPNPGFAADMATQAELDAHVSDTTDAHDASAISVADSGANYTATDVEGVLAEIAPQLGGGIPDLQYESRSTNTILGVADKGKAIDITAAITQTFDADETLGDGWWVILRNATDDGTTVVVLNPAGTETIDGLTTVTMYSGESRLIMCNGSGGNFNSVLLEGGFALFTADDNFIVPHGISNLTVACVGAGGGGGGGRGGAAGTNRQGGSGGGGGARVRKELSAGALGNPGDAITVDIGAGGTPGTGGSSADGSSGGTGAPTTFGTFVKAFGGGGGNLGSTASGRSGGSGAGLGAEGTVGGTAAIAGGSTTTTGVIGRLGAGAGATTTANGFGAEIGGGGGSGGSGTLGSPTPAGAGGTSADGGGGGGGGAQRTAANADNAAGVGGATGETVTVGTGGGGAGGGTGGGGAGDPGTDGDGSKCGAGGGGGASNSGSPGGAGGNGGAPAGGGGGGGGGTTVGGDGGTGGRGECRVWYS